MRRVGTLPSEEHARRFEDYLLARGVKADVEPNDGRWDVWVHDEDDLEQSRRELDEFTEDPEAERFTEGAQAAAELREEQEKQRRQAAKQHVEMRRRWERPSAHVRVTSALIAVSIAVAVIGTDWRTPLRFCDQTEPILTYLYIAPVLEGNGDLLVDRSLQAVLHGQVWRVVTPVFLHFGPLHLIFNMLWLRQLGGAIEFRRGSGRLLGMVLAIAVLSNLAQFYLRIPIFGGREGPSPLFGGMSGVVFGLFGYIWMKGRHEPEAGLQMPPQLVFFMVAWFLICVTGAVGRIANTAHGVGLMTGLVIGYGPTFWRTLHGR